MSEHVYESTPLPAVREPAILRLAEELVTSATDRGVALTSAQRPRSLSATPIVERGMAMPLGLQERWVRRILAPYPAPRAPNDGTHPP